MRARVSAQSHLEYRPTGYHWRRRWPRRVLRLCTPSKRFSLLFSLRSHVLPDAKALAQKLTLLSDSAFAGVTERTMVITPDIMERLLEELCRFLIEAADVAREMAPLRTSEAAAYDLACANAAVDTLRHAIATRDRERARHPLREVAARLGIAVEEADPDWQKLAFRALRVMLDAEQENARRDQGDFGGPSGALNAARRLVDFASPACTLPDLPRAVPMPPASTPVPPAASMSAPAVSLPPSVPQHAAPTEAALVQPPEVINTETTPIAAPPRAPSQLSTSCPTIEQGAQDYIEARSQGYKTFKVTEQANESAGKSWARNTAPNVRSTARLFSRILGDKPFDQITDQELTAAWELTTRIPHNYQAKTSKKSPQEAADEADATEQHNQEITRARLKKKGASPGKIESELLKNRISRLRAATIYRHMQDFQRICVFLVKKGHLATNIMSDQWSRRGRTKKRIMRVASSSRCKVDGPCPRPEGRETVQLPPCVWPPSG